MSRADLQSNKHKRAEQTHEQSTLFAKAFRNPSRVAAVLVALGVVGIGLYVTARNGNDKPKASEQFDAGTYLRRQDIETSGFLAGFGSMALWDPQGPLDQHADAYRQSIPRGLASLDRHLERGFHPLVYLQRAALLHSKGDPQSAYATLEELDSQMKGTIFAAQWQYTNLFYKGITALRLAENENCILCRGESSCIFPIAPMAIHKNTRGSRTAIKHFTEYLAQFPDDLEVKWLLNLAHMTVGESPDQVDPRYRLSMQACSKSEFDIGRFRDVGHLVGVNRLNQSGGAIMDDFDNDGLFDFVVTCWAPSESMAFYRNRGDGQVEDRTKAMGLEDQLGGLYCVQVDYNNDGRLDVFIPRGSWLPPQFTQRPSLLRNNPEGTFTDVAEEAGVTTPSNSTSASWADYDNDGWADLFICCQNQPSLLYRNQGNGTFEQVRDSARLPGDMIGCLGATWIDVDNDGYPELFVNLSSGIAGGAGVGTARLFRNNRNGTFSDCTRELGIDGPMSGFSCWTFDFDNDGWLDIFATSTAHSLEQIVQGLLDLPCSQKYTAKLYRNLEGKGFRDISQDAGVNKVYSPMGSNFGDLDNDGYLDFYLGTGDPGLSTLVPNRLFKNVAGKRFSEITASSRTGHLQKGHGIAFGDWDRNGTQDIFIELGGAIHGDRYHNVLFQNPGQGNNWLSVKLIGQKTNRAAIGARIKVTTTGDEPLTVHRHVTSGSSFGANPLEQHIGLGKAIGVATLEIYWPTSGTTQVFRDIPINQGLIVTEFADNYQTRTWKPIELPE